MDKEISFEIIELEDKTYHPLLKAEFQGLDNCWWVIDTGASKSVFDVSLTGIYEDDNEDKVMATGLGKEVVETSSGKIAQLFLGDYDFGKIKVALVDFVHINDEYAKFTDKKIVGLLGSDFLYVRRARIDFEMLRLTLAID